MKNIIFLLLNAITVLADQTLIRTLSREGFPAKISIAVCDQDGNSVPEATVQFSFGYSSGKKSNIVIVTTDDNGIASGQGKTNSRVVIQVFKRGYYNSVYTHRVWRGSSGFETGRWEPWDQKINIILYKEKKPQTGSIRGVFSEKLDPLQKHGIDLISGRLRVIDEYDENIDLIIETTGSFYDTKTKFHGPWERFTKFSFVHDGDGVIEKKLNNLSCLRYEYEAPKTGYIQSVNYISKCIESKRITYKDFPSMTNDYLVFRISRKTQDEQSVYYYGIIESWSVGKDWRTGNINVNIDYRLNSEPGDRNIEYH